MTLRSRTLLGSLILLWLLYFNIKHLIYSSQTTTTNNTITNMTTNKDTNTKQQQQQLPITTSSITTTTTTTTSLSMPSSSFPLDTPSLLNTKIKKEDENKLEDKLLDENTPIINRFNDDEKYITFFTHSGFQNQLIQVENGILLAWYLNRTLILPKALLGEPFGWSYFKKLQLEHRLRDITTSEDCEEYKQDIEQWDINCPNRNNYAMIPFDQIFDLSWAKQHVKIIVREETNEQWLRSALNIHTSTTEAAATSEEEDDQQDINIGSYVDGDILYFKGGTRYDWRIFDTPRKSQRLGKYQEALNIYELRRRKEKLIHFTSLFGSGKLPIRRPEHYEFLRSLQRSITYRHPAVLQMSDFIINQLGGAGNYIGLHVRSGDGWFVNALPDTLRTIVSQIDRSVQSKSRQQQKKQLKQQTLLFDPNNNNNNNNQEEKNEYETQPQQQGTSSSPTSRDYYLNKNGTPNLEKCVAAAQKDDMTLIYVATDAREPRKNEAFDPLWQSYPCSFTIHDILSSSILSNNIDNNVVLDQDDEDITIEDNDNEEIATMLSSDMGWSILDKERNPSTGASMRKFLLPLVDASISSRGWFFIGSKGSTFSGYIHRLHDIFWSATKKQQFNNNTV
ncbi:hypothetical protein BJ944DRAFT_269008 [Cunninghamella echinulata]|nr:hypothetical protein BJ944DRAFT_269008 [Cunninghamella echinulata]